jgi:hypothetical protein
MFRLQANMPRTAVLLHIEFAAAHEIVTVGIRADEAAFLIMKFGAANWTELPPVFRSLLLCFGQLGLLHRSRRIGDAFVLVMEIPKLDKLFFAVTHRIEHETNRNI